MTTRQTQLTAETITTAQITALRAEAGAAGDQEMVLTCDQALYGHCEEALYGTIDDARSVCVVTINAARAMEARS